MSELPFRALDTLDKQIIPNKQEEVRINFGKDAETTQYLEETDDTGEAVAVVKTTNPIKIFDRRKTSTIDRNALLERLREKDVFITKPLNALPSIRATELVPPAPIAPIKRKLVIKDSVVVAKERLEIEPEPEPEEEEAPNVEEGDELKDLNDILARKEEEEKIDEKDREEVARVIQEAQVTEQPKKKGRKLKIKGTVDDKQLIESVDLTVAAIRGQAVADRLPKEREKMVIKAPTYYMNNRKIVIQKLTELFAPYRQELAADEGNVSCESRAQSGFELLTHQKVVRDYLNLYTPYRGLLLYHGLGAGKTASSIAVAEGMKSDKRVFVMTPASLKMNFFSEMKKYGDEMYKKNQFWEFISVDGKPEYVNILAKALSLSTDYIRKRSGAWLLNIKISRSNYNELTAEQQEQLDDQLNEMIRSKYTDINYNGLNMNKLQNLTGDFSRNPFDNSVVVIDEAHNFVSRIVNKIKKPKSISYILYDLLMSATNARIVLLSGTPIINYPNEVGILFNILRGYIKTWTMTVNVTTSEKINTDSILAMLDKEHFNTFDYVEYSGNNLTVTRNPFGFVNTKKRGVLKGTVRAPRVKGGETPVLKPTPIRKTKKNRPLIHVDTSNGFAEKLSYPKEEITYDESAEKLYDDGMNGENNPYKGGEPRVPPSPPSLSGVNNKGGFERESLVPFNGGGEVFDKYNGVKLDDTGNLNDADFLKTLLRILRKNGLDVPDNSIEIKKYKALPDDPDAFLSSFVNAEAGIVKNVNLFQRRILGLTSYFRSAQEQLLPSFVKTAEGDDYHVVKTPLSEHQLGIYEKIRKEEADQESKNKKKRLAKKDGDELFSISSTYRIFSRAACNFVFPPDMERPVPTISADKVISENAFDAVPKNLRQDNDNYMDAQDAEFGASPQGEDDANPVPDVTETDASKYAKRIEKALEDINAKVPDTNKSVYLNKDDLPMLSPKFAKVLENLTSPDNEGLHLLYSHFRTIEGIGILRLILLANGFIEFKIKKTGDTWLIEDNGVESEEDAGKPRFVLYTGTETEEEKEIIRNVYNGTWDLVPASISKLLREKAENNNLGEVIKIFMITSSGAEGINLRNTRFVHIIEPYWHMVRPDQVVGRARRICSHQDLPEEMRTVKVFLYVSTLSEEQKIDKKHIELRIRDVSRLDKKTPVTTDETLYEMATIKQRINNQILKAVKETAVDCNLYSAQAAKSGEPLVCYGYGKIESNQFGSYPSFEKDRDEKEGLDLRVMKWTARMVKLNGKEYAMNENTNELYDLESYNRAIKTGSEPILVGRLVKKGDRYEII